MRRRDVVVFAELDWGGLHCQSHVYAHGLAQRGHRVLYINRTLQRWPTIDHLRRRLRSMSSGAFGSSAASVPHGIEVVTLLHVPPTRSLRPVNRMLVRKQLARRELLDPIMLVYVPSYLAIDVATVFGVREYHYVCYHNFDADRVLPDLLRSEREIVAGARSLFADSEFLRQRLEKMAPGRRVNSSEPGVHYERFATCYRGDEASRRRQIVYFGGIGPHLNIDAYNALSEEFEVRMIGIVDGSVRKELSGKIEVIPAVANLELPALLRGADVLALLYRDSPYMRGVIPAKFYECLATGKPLLASGLAEVERFGEIVHLLGEDPALVVRAVHSLDAAVEVQVAHERRRLARTADWANRLSSFCAVVFGEATGA